MMQLHVYKYIVLYNTITL